MKALMTFCLSLVALSAHATSIDAVTPQDAGPAQDVPPFPKCTTSADCGPNDSCQGGLCLWAGPPCKVKTDCTFEKGEGCKDGHCQFIGPPCKTQKDCFSGEYACNDGFCEWVGCTSDAACIDGMLCDPTSKMCVAKACASHADCPAAGTKCVYGACGVPLPGSCQTTPDCGAYAVCELNPNGGGGSTPGSVDAGSSAADVAPGPSFDPWGLCLIDVPALPADATCAALCETLATCEAEASVPAGADAGTAAQDVVAMPDAALPGQKPAPIVDYKAWSQKLCGARCDFAQARKLATAAIADYAACAEKNKDCKALLAFCVAEQQTLIAALESLPATPPSELLSPPDVDPPPTGAETPLSWGDTAGGQLDAATSRQGTSADASPPPGRAESGGTDVSPGGDATITGDAGTTKAPSGGGCQSGPPGGAGWVAAVALLLALGARRRPIG